MKRIEEFTRQEIENAILHAMSMVLKKEDYTKLSEILRSMSDQEIFLIGMQSLTSIEDEKNSRKKQVELLRHLQETAGINSENSALNYVPIKFLSDSENATLLRRISETMPTDIIKINHEQDNELIDLWEKGNTKNVLIPSDLFWNRTVPLQDLKIEVDERKRFFEKQKMYGKLITYRVVIFGDLNEKINKISENEVLTVGALILDVPACTGNLIVPIQIAKGIDCIPIPKKLGFMNLNQNQRRLLCEKLSQATIGNMIVSYLETWYGIQIALLHPVVKEVFRNPNKIKVSGKEKIKSRTCNKKLKYVRCHVVDNEKLKFSIYGNNGTSINRKALIWHVIGHWRTYKNGRKVFIKPYWKGALRENKQLQEIREREIEINESQS